MLAPRASAVVGLLVLLPAAGRAQQLLYQISGPDPSFGNQVVGLGDVNGDGCSDFAISAVNCCSVPPYVSSITVYSGKTQQVLGTLQDPAPSAQSWWGITMGSAGDIDGDGRADIYVALQGTRVMLYSTKTWQLLRTITSGQAFRHAGVGDVNGDGYSDLVVTSGNQALVVSGKDGSVIRSLAGGAGFAAGYAVGDVDKDGRPDVMVRGELGFAACYSGRTGQLLWSAPTSPFFGSAPTGDTNADGVPDIVGVEQLGTSTTSPFELQVHSGSNGALLFKVGEAAMPPRLSFAVGAGDVNRDGRADILVSGGQWVSVLSGKDGSPFFILNPPQARVGVRDFASVGDVDGDGSPEFAVSWSGLGQATGLVGVYTLTHPTYTTYGLGCPGSAGIPSLAPVPGQLPKLGDSFTLQVSKLPPLAATFLHLGLSNTKAFGLSLPFDLAPIGMPACMLYCSAEFALPVGNITGSGLATISIANSINLLGARFWNQAVVVDRSANPLGLTVSNAGEGKIGN